ncbi:hypothetical protein MB84_28255 (plasmid) [Pandoraea oxalativorans]|uniref:Uncharacterized protein n=2 Tax=Pandoraea oxalativorans TaxID=573737 RepID=A0A0G3IBY1_9BURK|nr:hypothetical protein MB84_28255 [Pandoraea oxalativorans]
MTKLTFEAIKQMTYEDLEAIGDPMDLTGIGFISPMLVAYAVRTGQLHSRYAGIALPELLNAINNATTMIASCPDAIRNACSEQRDVMVDAYLDRLQQHIRAALRPH